MKKCFFILIIVFCLLIPIPSYAQDIQTGNSSVQNSVTNTVNGSGCLTHIEVIVNGEKRVLDSTDCGTHSLNISSNSSSQSPLPSASVFIPQKTTVSISPSPVSSATPVVIPEKKIEMNKSSFFPNLTKYLQDFLKKIFINFAVSIL